MTEGKLKQTKKVPPRTAKVLGGLISFKITFNNEQTIL